MAGSKVNAQVIIEFIVSFTCLLLIIVLTTKMFAWFGQTIVRRHLAYEGSRTVLLDGNNKVIVPPVDFYVQKDPLNVLNE